MIKKYFQELIKVSHAISVSNDLSKKLELIIDEIYKCLISGHKILIAGNGGSAADAQHFSAEIVGRYKNKRRGYPAIALNTNNSILTACANDFGYGEVFSRQVEAFGVPGDIFIAISTSGNSLNIIKAAKIAKKKGIKVVSLLGFEGGKIKAISDFKFIVPSKNTPRIQEIHTILIHIICEEIEKLLK